MAEHTSLTFTDHLLETDTIICALCNGILRPPIILVEHTGNVCEACFIENKKSMNQNILNNYALDTIIKMLLLPCKFNKKGCTLRLDCKEVLLHQNSCKYRTKLCSFKNSGCNWEGNLANFMNHLTKKHADHVISLENNQFSLQTSIDDLEVVKLLVIMNDPYLLHMQLDSNKKKLFYLICKVSDASDEFFEYSVKHKGSSNSYIKTKSRILSACNIYDEEIDKSVAVEVDLESLKQVAQVLDTITSTFKFKVAGIPVECLDPIMLHFFECIVCKNYMKPPIYQCQSGHSFCNSCTSRMERCPTCRSAFRMTRNYSLEGLSEGLQYPCTFRNLGCPEVSVVKNILKHESECAFKPYACPFPKCSASGDQKKITNHLRDFHSENTVFSGIVGYTESFYIDYNSIPVNKVFVRKCVMAYDTMFWMTCRQVAEECFWAVQVVRPADLSTTFVYEVTIEDTGRPARKMIKSDYCLNECLEEEVFRKCIMFSLDTLHSYSNNFVITFHVKIKPSGFGS